MRLYTQSLYREEANDWAVGPKMNNTGVVPNPMGWVRQMAGRFGPEEIGDGGEGLYTAPISEVFSSNRNIIDGNTGKNVGESVCSEKDQWARAVGQEWSAKSGQTTLTRRSTLP